MEIFITIILFLACITMIGTILLQPGKTDAGALFTSNISSTAFGPRGTQTILSKITIGAAAVFMLAALFLSFPALTGRVSVLQTTTEQKTETPAANTDANVPSVGPAANATDANSAANTAPANAPAANSNAPAENK